MATVVSVSKSAIHSFSKQPVESIILLAGLGVEGDAHKGETVKHRSRVKADPSQPNLRQVHLIHSELIKELQDRGFNVFPGTMGENITTDGIDLLSLPTHTIIRIGSDVVIQITGLRNPCAQLDHYQKGLTAAVLDRDEEGNLIRKAGIMAIVLQGGVIQAGDPVIVELPDPPYQPLQRV